MEWRHDQPGRARHLARLGQVCFHRHRVGPARWRHLDHGRGLPWHGRRWQGAADNSGADLWVVQQDTLGPYAESSSIPDDLWRSIRTMPGVAQVANVTYLTMQVGKGDQDVRAMVVGIMAGEPGTPGWPAATRCRAPNHAATTKPWPMASGAQLGDVLKIRRNHYTVVGLTRRMVSSKRRPDGVHPVERRSEAQFLKRQRRHPDAATPDRSQPRIQSAQRAWPARCCDRIADA